MTTIRSHLFARLTAASGLEPEQANAVLATLEPEFGSRFERSLYDYPTAVIQCFGEIADKAAVQWIDANCPKSYARERFAGAKKS